MLEPGSDYFEQQSGVPNAGIAARLQPRLLFTSGFLRALETCYPIAESLQTAPELHSDLHEEGGVFEGPRRGVRRESYPMHHGLNAQRMCEVLPSLKVTESVPEQGWWPGGVEQPAAATDRAHRCAEWLWKLAEEQGAEESRSSESPGAEEEGTSPCGRTPSFHHTVIDSREAIRIQEEFRAIREPESSTKTLPMMLRSGKSNEQMLDGGKGTAEKVCLLRWGPGQIRIVGDQAVSRSLYYSNTGRNDLTKDVEIEHRCPLQ
ncbi:hypothetical protein AK812_SmicGene27953 [Symbiodinium microadriaticum]|uniref:Uncharacterized protein n=1 Tax=Symbiodinium microadriaticum TaxID=2951 RepID=A0A1Q9D5S8_SYMMI|nr:hypothetical protein AK812_SmicGene27953 [Symbiodinium microadriaticum]